MAARQALNLKPVVRLHLPHPALLALLFIIHHYFEREECSQTEAAFSIADAITQAGDAITAAVGVVWNICTANPWLTLMIGVSLVGTGFVFFRKARRTTN